MPAQAAAHETIIECLAEAQSDSPGDQCAALQTLASLTKVSSHNRNLLAQTPGALPTILALAKLSSSSHLALSILFHLSLNRNLKRSLAEPDTILHLNSLILFPSSHQSSKLAASLICSLAMLDKNKARFGVSGTVDALIKALGDTTTSCGQSARQLLSSLIELVQFHGNSTLAVRAGAVPVLVGILEDPAAEDLAGSSLAILGLLARYEEGIGAIRGVDGVVGLLVGGLSGCMMSQESAAEILIRLFEESEEYIKEAAGEQEFSSLLADLSIRGSAKAREKAGELMKKMMEANLDCYVEGSPMILRV